MGKYTRDDRALSALGARELSLRSSCSECRGKHCIAACRNFVHDRSSLVAGPNVTGWLWAAFADRPCVHLARRVGQLMRQKRHLEDAVKGRTADLEREKTELVRTREQMRHFAEHDGLTGLWNHRIIVERLRGEVDRSQRDGTPVSIILVDLDYFKHVNDTMGHRAGDLTLQETGAIFQRAVRSYDWVGRYGGEEFLLILPGSDYAAAHARAGASKIDSTSRRHRRRRKNILRDRQLWRRLRIPRRPRGDDSGCRCGPVSSQEQRPKLRRGHRDHSSGFPGHSHAIRIYATGRRIVARAPGPSSRLRSRISPPCARAICCASAKPTPLPVGLVV